MRQSILLLLILLVSPPTSLFAQGSSSTEGVSLTASLRSRGEAWNWFESAADGDYVYSGNLIRAGLTQQRERIGWQLELAAPILLGLPTEAIAPLPQGQAGAGATYYAANDRKENVASVFLKQAYVRLGAAPGTPGHGARVGRFEFVGGAEVSPASATLASLKRDRIAHRLVGTFGWSHVGRSFDGVHYAFGGPGINITAVAARPTQGVFNADGWKDLDVGLAYASLTLPQARSRHPGEGRLFGAFYADYREEFALLGPDGGGTDDADIAIVTLGGHYLREITAPGATVDVLLWGALQAGEYQLDDHRAWAAAAELGVQPAVMSALRPWLRLGWSKGSGDGDPGDRKHGTFFQMLTTPRIYARFPFYNQMNTEEVFGSLILRPLDRLSVRTDVRGLWLSRSSDLWYSGGGAYESDTFGFGGRPSGGGDHLGVLADVSVELRLHQKLTSTLYLGWVDGGEVVEATYPNGPSARLAYLELEYRR